MAIISNTTYQNTIDSLANGFNNSLLANPYYIYNNYSPTVVTYYAINKCETTLDYSLKTSYAVIGERSPIRYNKINEFVLYGIEKIQLNLDNGEQGLESQDITGDCYFLPNTVVPSAGDFFVINQLKQKFLFVVESVNKDTMDNDANFYKGSYRLEQFQEDEITAQVVKEYTYVISSSSDNNGVSSSSIIEQEAYYSAQSLEQVCIHLEETYMALFYNERVQTFTYKFNCRNMYDEYMIEFIIRNKLFSDVSKYIYVDHKTSLNRLFPIYYKHSIFYNIETKNKDITNVHVNADYIDDPTTIFQQRYEDYFSVNHKLKIDDFYADPRAKAVYNILPDLIIDLISSGESFNSDYLENNNIEDKEFSNLLFTNIIISYMNGIDITDDDISILTNSEYYYSKTYFYAIPIVIYCLKQYIKNLIV